MQNTRLHLFIAEKKYDFHGSVVVHLIFILKDTGEDFHVFKHLLWIVFRRIVLANV